MPTAMVTGAPERVSDVAIALKSEGFDILAATADLERAPSDARPGSVDCYVQLPGDTPAGDDAAVARARAVVAGDVLDRFDAVVRLGPLLAPGATVLLVAGGNGQPGAWRATRRLVSVLAEAIARDHGARGIRATVVDGDGGPDEIVALARSRGRTGPSWRVYAGVDPALPFTEWRDEVLCQLSAG